MISIFTLNLWRYYEFEQRIPNIIAFITEKKPDVILLQEAQIDQQHSIYSKAEIMQKSLPDYKFVLQSTIYLKTSQRGILLETPIQQGIAILSKHPIIKSFEYYLPQAPSEEPRSNLCFDI